MLWRCGTQFEFRYVKNIRHEPGLAAVVGQGAHKSAEDNLRRKLETGALMSEEEVEQTARDATVKHYDDGVHLLPEEKSLPDHGKGQAIDEAVNFARVHHRRIAPKIDPVSVERPWVVRLNGLPFDLAGKFDVEEKKVGRDIIRDLKTTRKSPPKRMADNSEQLTIYALAKSVVDGRPADELRLDYLVQSKRTGTRHVELSTTRTKEDLDVAIRRIANASRAIELGHFVPTDQSNWHCSPRWCGYTAICPYYRGKTTFGMTHNEEEEEGSIDE
jgi:RecB family exonuclease